MKAYLSVFRIRFIAALQYRAAALSALATGFVWGLMELLAFAAFYRADAAAFPMPFPQLASYVWIKEAFLMLFSLTSWDNEFSSAIESGSIAYELARPISLYGRWCCQAAGNRLAKAFTRGAPILLLAALLPFPYRFSLPPSAAQMALFLCSLALSLGVVVAFSMLMYTCVFYMLTSRGIKLVVGLLADFLAGGVIPLPFFPASVRNIVELTPFAAMQNMPLRIYGSNIAGADALWGIALQAFWLALLIFLGRAYMRRALRRVIAQGG